MKKISVIIPIYNAEKYIKSTLYCIINQTYKNLEIICVLDAPTDNSEKIIKSFRDKRIKIVKHKKNLGQAEARNNGIKYATGDYIHFMDSDDIVSPDFYTEMVACIKDADVAACNVFYEKKPHRSIWLKNQIVTGKNKLKKTKVLDKGWAWRWLIRRDFWNKNAFAFPNLITLEDKPVMVQMVYKATKIQFCSNAVYIYKNRISSILNNKYDSDELKKLSENRHKARKLIKDFLRDAKRKSSKKSEFRK